MTDEVAPFVWFREPIREASDKMTEEPASQEEQPTQIPATAIPTPEVTAVPEDTLALEPEATPEPAVPEEGAAVPEMTDTPETTAAPEATEPTEVHDPLVLSLTTDVRWAFADGNAIDVMLLIESGCWTPKRKPCATGWTLAPALRSTWR